MKPRNTTDTPRSSRTANRTVRWSLCLMARWRTHRPFLWGKCFSSLLLLPWTDENMDSVSVTSPITFPDELHINSPCIVVQLKTKGFLIRRKGTSAIGKWLLDLWRLTLHLNQFWITLLFSNAVVVSWSARKYTVDSKGGQQSWGFIFEFTQP